MESGTIAPVEALASENISTTGKKFPKLTQDLAEGLGPLTRKHFADKNVGRFTQKGIHPIYNMDMAALDSGLYDENCSYGGGCYRGSGSCP